MNNVVDIPSWEELFFRQVYLIASKSKSITSKIGAVLVDWEGKSAFSHGFNGLPRGINDDVFERKFNRDIRVFYDIHAELNSILNCARGGFSTCGSYMFTNAMPCSLCAAAIVQAGIKKVIYHKQWRDAALKESSWGKWVESAKRSNEIFYEARTEIEEFDQILGVQGLLGGKIINV